MEERPPQQQIIVDPSALTIQMVWREIAALKELVASDIGAMKEAIKVAHDDLVRVPTDVEKAVGTLKELQDTRFECVDEEGRLVRTIIETRFDGNDKAIRLLQDTADKFPGRIDEKIVALEKVHEEKFASIAKQFDERDVRTEQAAKDSKVAVDAALAAQEKAVGKQAEAFQEATSKSDQQFTKQIDQQGELLRTEVKGLVTQINELKDRFNRGEGVGVGAKEQKTDTRLNLGVLITVAALIVGVAGIIVAIILKS